MVEALGRDHVSATGALVDGEGCYNKIKGVAPGNKLIWSDYFLLEAALALDGRLEPTHL